MDSLSLGLILTLRNTTDLGIVNRQLISTILKQQLQVQFNSNKQHHRFGNCNQAVTFTAIVIRQSLTASVGLIENKVSGIKNKTISDMNVTFCGQNLSKLQ